MAEERVAAAPRPGRAVAVGGGAGALRAGVGKIMDREVHWWSGPRRLSHEVVCRTRKSGTEASSD